MPLYLTEMLLDLTFQSGRIYTSLSALFQGLVVDISLQDGVAARDVYMSKLDEINYYYGRPICRLCINHLYNVHLVTKDCVYNGEDMNYCACCRQQRHLVIGLNGSGKRKLLFKKRVEDLES